MESPAGKGRVRVEAFDVLGRPLQILLGQNVTPGNYNLVWDGRDAHGRQMPSGPNLYRMTTRNYQKVRQMILMK